jgi:hypothetical protein
LACRMRITRKLVSCWSCDWRLGMGVSGRLPQCRVCLGAAVASVKIAIQTVWGQVKTNSALARSTGVDDSF